jgi:hypothetical protein
MAFIEQKGKILGKVGALNVLNERGRKFNTTNSLSSINNKNNVIEFLSDLAIILVGYDRIKETFANLLSNQLSNLESEIKNNLKKEIKEFTNCNLNPSLPPWIKSNSNGVTVQVNKVDFFNLFKTSPNSTFGSLLYDDITSGINSTDLNTFIFNNMSLNKNNQIPSLGNFYTWQDIIDVKFNPVGLNNNNILTIKANPNYDNKSLTELNNDLIDSITIFGSSNNINVSTLLMDIFDRMFGSITSSIGKGKNQTKNEIEIEEIIENIINTEDETIIDDSFFSFSNEENKLIDYIVNNKTQGYGVLETCGNQDIIIDSEILIQINSNLSNSQLNVDQTSIITNSFDTIANVQSNDVSPVDRDNVRGNFIIKLVKLLPTSIIKHIISPKLMILFVINNKIIYGENYSHNDFRDFLKQNRNLIRNISKLIIGKIIELLLSLVLKEIAKKVAKKVKDDNIEKLNLYRNMLTSLLPIPNSVINQLSNFN